jgi:division protein CdvB (Snf7/Vps24/ESCRT-III family)
LDFKQGFKGIKNSLQNEIKDFDKKIKVLEKEIKNFEKNKTKKSNYQEINLHSQNAIFRRQALIEDLKFDKESLQDSYDKNFIERNSDLLINFTKGT